MKWTLTGGKRGLWDWVELGITFILVIIVIFAFIDGYFIRKEVHFIEVCEGVPQEIQPETLKLLEEQGWTKTNNNQTKNLELYNES